MENNSSIYSSQEMKTEKVVCDRCCRECEFTVPSGVQILYDSCYMLKQKLISESKCKRPYETTPSEKTCEGCPSYGQLYARTGCHISLRTVREEGE